MKTPLALDSAVRRAAALRTATILVVLVCFAAQLQLLYLMRAPIRQGYADYINFYAAGRIVATGNGSRLYDVALQQQIEAEESVRSSAANFLPFVHPPFFALLMAGPAVLHYPAAYGVWWVCNQCFFWLAIFVIGRSLGGSWLPPARIACAALLFLPLTVAFWQGQDAVLNLLLFSLAFLFLEGDRPLLAGAAIGLATFKPQLALLMLGMLMVTSRNKRRLATGFVLSCLGQIALIAAVLGWGILLVYPKFLSRFAARFDENRFKVNLMPNLRGILHTLLGNHLGNSTLGGVTLVLSALLLAGALYVLHDRRAQSHPRELRHALVVATAFLAAYYGFFHDMTLLLLPLLMVWEWLARTGARGARRRVMAVGVAAPFVALLAGMLVPSLLGPVFALTGLFFWAALMWNLRAPLSPACPEVGPV